MFALYIFTTLFFMSSTLSFRFSSFKYVTQEIKTSVARMETRTHETAWLKQRLDHFDKNEKRTWKMRYFRRGDFWKQNGPIYIQMGGEGEQSYGYLYSGVTYELAKETNGLYFATEHRYYGKSTPINATNVKDLKYLSARQALADHAHFIRTLKRNPKFRKSKIVVAGCSYSGNLAVWMRVLYPRLVDAVISSSAPVLAKKDFYECIEKVGDVFKQYGSEGCWAAINNQFKHYENMFKTKEGIDKIKEDESICDSVDMNITKNRQSFFLSRMSPFMGIAQYGDTKKVEDRCHTFNTSKKLSKFNEFGLWSKQKVCYDIDFKHMIEHNYKDKMSDKVRWTYQTCTEFGYFQTTTSNRHPFTNNVPVQLFVSTCRTAYGKEFDESRIDRGIDNVNKMYGGLKPNVTNVVFVNGDLDPWSRLGILKGLSENAPAIVIPRASHCRDIFSDRDGDEKELKDARTQIKNYIKKWIGFHK